MNTPTLVTKIYRPQTRAQTLPRPGLFAQLSAGLDHPLTILSAPAGFGKTTLLSGWIDSLGHTQAVHLDSREMTPERAAWLTLDRNDNDPYQFWAYVIAAMQTVEPALAADAQAALLSTLAPPLPALVSTLINTVAVAHRPLILALDDYHLIDNEAIHASLNELLDHLPANWRIVMTTREDPPLALARRRARGELVELRAANLRFSPAETAEMLNTRLGLALEDEDIAALYRRTEGWAVGLHLAALSLQSRTPGERREFIQSFAGDDQFIFDYLMDEVFRNLPTRQQNFMLRTCLLERLSAPLCAAVSGFDDCAVLLHDLEHANLFTQPLDNRRQWYRYHPLFADLLRKRLYETESQAAIRALQREASAWHEREGLIAEAVAYAFAAQDEEYAARLLERHILDAFYRSEIYQVHRWLKTLPEAVLRRHPLLCAVYANTLALIHYTPESYEQAEQWLQVADAGLAAEVGPLRPETEETSAYIAKFRAYLARFRGAEPVEVIRLARSALEKIPQNIARFRGALCFLLGRACLDIGDEPAALAAFADAWTYSVACGDWFNALAAANTQAQMAGWHGSLRRAIAINQETLDFVSRSLCPGQNLPPSAGIVFVSLGSLLLEKNELEEARLMLKRGLEMLVLTTLPEFQMTGNLTLARVACLQGDLSLARSALRQAGTFQLHPSVPVQAFKIRAWLALAEADSESAAAVDHWAMNTHLDRETAGNSDTQQREGILLARWLVMRAPVLVSPEHPDRRILPVYLDEQLEVARRHGRIGLEIEILALRALASQAMGDGAKTRESLRQAIDLARPEGYMRMFLDLGPEMARLLRQALEDAPGDEYISRLVAMCGDKTAPETSRSRLPAARPGNAVAEPLSAREIDVLALLAEGLTNRQIAERLYLSPNTVRIHTSNIYAKLGVGSRTQAVARARVLGLLN